MLRSALAKFAARRSHGIDQIAGGPLCVRKALTLPAVHEVDLHGCTGRVGVATFDRSVNVLVFLMNLLQMLRAPLHVQP